MASSSLNGCVPAVTTLSTSLSKMTTTVPPEKQGTVQDSSSVFEDISSSLVSGGTSCEAVSPGSEDIPVLPTAMETAVETGMHTDKQSTSSSHRGRLDRSTSAMQPSTPYFPLLGPHKEGVSNSGNPFILSAEEIQGSSLRWDIRPAKRRTKSLYGASPSCRFGPKASVMKNQSAVLTIQDPGAQQLIWYKVPITVLVIKKIRDPDVIPPFIELIKFLIDEKRMLVYIDIKNLADPLLTEEKEFQRYTTQMLTFTEDDDLTDKIDFIICLGGDGTLIYTSSLFQENVPPVMAFHLGSLGFLSSFEFVNFRESVERVMEGNVALTLRTRLKCSIAKSGTVCSETDKCSIKNVESRTHMLVLNEVVVDRGPCPYLCNVDLYIEHRYVTSVQGDGLIISTPTGSTAYAAAAGASMVHPSVPAIIIAPICPHSLSFRPIVVPAGVEIRIMVAPEARGGCSAAFDGRQRQELNKGDVLRISTSIYPVPSICGADQISDWFDSLAECLHWNVRKPQKGFPKMPHIASTDSLDSTSSAESQKFNGVR